MCHEMLFGGMTDFELQTCPTLNGNPSWLGMRALESCTLSRWDRFFQGHIRFSPSLPRTSYLGYWSPEGALQDLLFGDLGG